MRTRVEGIPVEANTSCSDKVDNPAERLQNDRETRISHYFPLLYLLPRDDISFIKIYTILKIFIHNSLLVANTKLL